MLRTIPIICSLVLVLLETAPAAHTQAVPTGIPFQVNTYTTGAQGLPVVAYSADGSFVVVWTSNGSTGTDTGGSPSIQLQRFSSSAIPLGSQMQVNTYTTGQQAFPDLTVLPSGDVVVIWPSDGSGGDDSSLSSVQGQRIGSDGTPLGDEFQINTYTTSYQFFSAVASAPTGEFVVVWDSLGSAGSDQSDWSIQGQRFDADGFLIEGEFLVNTYTTSSQNRPDIDIDALGNAIVVWQSDGSDESDADGFSIQGQRFAPDGSLLGAQFQVNTHTTGDQLFPTVAAGTNGAFIVVWESTKSAIDSGNFGNVVQTRRFAADGTPIGSDFEVNTLWYIIKEHPRVAIDDDGSFLIAWQHRDIFDMDAFDIHSQLYKPDGSTFGPELLVNTDTTDHQVTPAVAIDSSNNFVVVWESDRSEGTDISSSSVHGQMLVNPLIFSDGFEGENTSVWSAAIH